MGILERRVSPLSVSFSLFIWYTALRGHSVLLLMLIGALNLTLEKRYAVGIESGLKKTFFSILPQIPPSRCGNVLGGFMTKGHADLNVRSPV